MSAAYRIVLRCYVEGANYAEARQTALDALDEFPGSVWVAEPIAPSMELPVPDDEQR